jgi:uncharacterized protein
MIYKIADHKIFNVKDHIFLFLAYESAIFELEPKVEKIINLFNEAQLNKEEIVEKIKVSGIDNYEELADTLIRQRLFIPSDAYEKYTNKIYNNKIKTLVFNITDACNLRCLYCYHNNGNYKENAMTTRTAEKAVDFLFDNSGSNDEVVIVFFGGEPILNFDLITFIVGYAQKKASKLKKKAEFAITTNGTLLYEEVIDFFYENEIGVTVSIDGSKKIHDRFRKFSNGGSSYDKMLPNIKNLIDIFREKGGKPVVARVTVAKDAKHVPETIEHLLKLGFAEAGFGPVTTDNLSFQLDNKEMTVLLNKFKELSDKFLQAALNDKFFGFTNLIDLLVILHEGEVKNYPCGAGLGLFAVSSDEKLYLCQRLIGNDSLCMGNLSDGFDISAVENFRKKAELSGKPECKTCWARFICAGGCYHEALVREKKLTKANLHYCKWIKEWIETGLKIYGRIFLENPIYLDKLSMLRGHEPIFGQVV